jgi:hypothetical protein
MTIRATPTSHEIAKQYGGENWNTGGNMHVAVIPLGPHDCMGVSGEVICRYNNSKRPAWRTFSTSRRTTRTRKCISLCG